ncbi:hypothetical protein G6F35_015730 [Rhizopus arrhizus]|nr:hypothetical protein G6F35_015730 [Rhizopus arrhizus]
MGMALAAVALPSSPVVLPAKLAVMAHPLAARAPPGPVLASVTGAPLGARAPPTASRRVAIWTALAFTPALHAQTAPVATLPAISVSGDTVAPTLLEHAATGTLLGLTPFETPASIDIISNEQLRARGATTVTDAITQAAGISAMRHPGNGGSSLSSRGFTDSNSVAQLYDGVRQYGGVGQTFIYDPWAAPLAA